MSVLEYPLLFTRGNGVLPKGQNSWNISVSKEANVDLKVVLESMMECPSGIIFFFTCKKMFKQTSIFQNDTSSFLIGEKQAEPIKGLLTAVLLFHYIIVKTVKN